MSNKITLIDLLKTNAWLSIETVLLQLYPSEKETIEEYKEVFNALLLMEPAKQNITIEITTQTDDFDGEPYTDVSGIYTNPKDNPEDFDVSLALEFTPWAQWLGMDIAPESLQNLTELEIIAHVLFEITFVSFNEEEIQEHIQQVNNEMEDYKNMSAEEKSKNTFTLDELKKHLGDDETSDN